MIPKTNLQKAVDSRLRLHGTTLPEWLLAQRRNGFSYEAAADHLRALTGDVLSHETLRLWSKKAMDLAEAA